MKHRWKLPLVLLVGLIALLLHAPGARAKDFDNDYRFIFYAVLEGCYEDGIATEDVARILTKDVKATNLYVNFVYACPLCVPTIHALEAYQSRPSHFYSMKTPATTFGPSLTPELKKQLYSAKSEDQLAVINTLVQGWVSRRIALLQLSEPDRAALQKRLEEMRKKGMSYLKNFEKDPASYPVAAFSTVHQCAVCNGACGLDLKPGPKK